MYAGDSKNTFHRLGKLALVLTLVVVVLGAFVRLSDAGLGCPDWPGCYGLLDVPETHSEISEANQAYPERPVEPAKAWKEMIHRYAASTLGFIILIMSILAWWRKRTHPDQPVWAPTFLVLMVIFQGLLGMWTVTLLLKPLVVSAHLMGGLTVLSLLWWILMRQGNYFAPSSISNAWALRRYTSFALVVVIVQIALGAWTSTNYAATACADFPTCQGAWLPANMDFAEAFVLWRGLGVNYEFGVLDTAARTAIHYTHRLGAIATTLVLLFLAMRLISGERDQNLKALGGMLIFALGLQLGIGIFMVELQFPLVVATAHNAGAAVLLMTTLASYHAVRTVPVL